MAIIGGRYILDPGTVRERVIPNNIIGEGAESFMKMMFRGTTTDVSVGGNFYLGLCGNTVPANLAALTGEPTVTNGYARKAISRDATGWPTIQAVTGMWNALSKTVTFTASGGAFSAAVRRMFLCNQSSGLVGILYSVSDPFLITELLAAAPLPSGQHQDVAFNIYIDTN